MSMDRDERLNRIDTITGDLRRRLDPHGKTDAVVVEALELIADELRDLRAGRD